MTKVHSQPMYDEPSPQELQAWADEAQACLDSGEVFVSDHRKAHATIVALRSHAALVKALEPFVEIAKELQPHLEDNYRNTMHWAVPTVGNFRAAAAILKEISR